MFHLYEDLYIFDGFETINEINNDTKGAFLATLRTTKYGKIIDDASIFSLLKYYQDFENFDIALSDYVFSSRSDVELLNDFTDHDKPFRFECFDSELKETLERMATQQRLDNCFVDKFLASTGGAHV